MEQSAGSMFAAVLRCILAIGFNPLLTFTPAPNQSSPEIMVDCNTEASGNGPDSPLSPTVPGQMVFPFSSSSSVQLRSAPTAAAGSSSAPPLPPLPTLTCTHIQASSSSSSSSSSPTETPHLNQSVHAGCIESSIQIILPQPSSAIERSTSLPFRDTPSNDLHSHMQRSRSAV